MKIMLGSLVFVALIAGCDSSKKPAVDMAPAVDSAAVGGAPAASATDSKVEVPHDGGAAAAPSAAPSASAATVVDGGKKEAEKVAAPVKK